MTYLLLELNFPLKWLPFLNSSYTNCIKYLFIQWEFKVLKASRKLEANSYSRLWHPASLYLLNPFSRISRVSAVACSTLPFALNVSHPTGSAQAFHFCFALAHKGITILSSMRLELKSLSASELTTYLMQLVLE
ncbi:MAG: hypothetical protein ACI8SJ_002448 [Shewanella sp.]|jgi:hypothetical protein